MKSLKLAFIGLMLLASATASAGPITPGAGWYGFCFDNGAGNPAFAGCQNSGIGTSGNSFTFSLSTPELLNVTDAFLFGDTFNVFVNSSLAFTTGGGTHVGATTGDPDVAFNSGAYDRGSLLLGPGTYSVNIFTNATPGGAGGAYIEVAARTVPEPGVLWLVAAGMLGFAALRRSKA